jgi:hypothetical protein
MPDPEDRPDFKRYRTRQLLEALVVVSVFAPVGVIVISNPSGLFTAYMLGLFYAFFVGATIPVPDGEMIPPVAVPFFGLPIYLTFALRIVFIYALYRYYTGTLSRRTAIVAGILTELLMFILSLPTIFFVINGANIGQYLVPIPVVSVIGLLLLAVFPRQEPEKPFDEHPAAPDQEEHQQTTVSQTVHCKLDRVGHRSPVLPDNGTRVTP